jgi:predicted phage-related endonuclease
LKYFYFGAIFIIVLNKGDTMTRPKGSINKIKRVRSKTVSGRPPQEIWINRSTGIASDEIVAVMNEPGHCARKLWYDKKGYEKDFDDTRQKEYAANVAVHLREIGRVLYIEKTKRIVRKSPKDYRSNLKPHLIAYIPELVINKRTKSSNPLFIATLNLPEYVRTKYEGHSISWLYNVQISMFVKNMQWAGIGLIGPEGEVVAYDIERDERLIADLLTACDNWWFEYFLANKIPPQIPAGKTCHLCPWRITCRPYVYNAKELNFSEQLNETVRLHFALGDMTREVEHSKDIVTGQLAVAMKDIELAKTIYGNIRHKKKRRLLLDSPRILTDYPEIRDKYVTASETDELTITPWFADTSTEIPGAPSS